MGPSRIDVEKSSSHYLSQIEIASDNPLITTSLRLRESPLPEKPAYCVNHGRGSAWASGSLRVAHFRDRDPIGDTVARERPRSVLTYVDGTRVPVDRVATTRANLQL